MVMVVTVVMVMVVVGDTVEDVSLPDGVVKVDAWNITGRLA